MTGPIQILMIEDNLGDVLLVREALAEADVPNSIRVVDNGVDALECLHRRGPYGGQTLPDLVLLDLNLPRKNGRDVLAEIKADAVLRKLPLVVFTSSPQEQDVLDGCDPTRCRYFVKPSHFHALVETVKKIESFWKSTRPN